MTMVVEPIEHLNATKFAPWIVFGQLFKHVNFKFGCFPILLDIFDYFERHNFIFKYVFDLHNLAKRALTESCHDFESVLQNVSGIVHQVSLSIILYNGCIGSLSSCEDWWYSG